ncbi:MAG: ArnT family glycosyltransferase [Actinomycetota bacterium]
MSSYAAAGYLVCVATCVALAAAALSRWAVADALDRALVGVIAGLTVPVFVGLLLGATGLLSPGPYLLAMLAIGIAAAAVLTRDDVNRRAPASWSITGTIAVLVGGVLALLALAPTLAGRLSQHVETANYHITNLVTWIRNHNIWELPFQNPGFFTATHPGNGEMLSAPMILATGSDQLAYVGNILVGALCVLACAMIARELDARPDLGAVVALALVGAPLVFATQAHSLATDLPATAGLLAAVAASLRARRSRDHRFTVVAGIALGFGLGSKYTVLLLAPVVVALAVYGIKPRVRTLVLLAPGLVVMSGPWFLRNALATGNPIFPQEVRVGGVELLTGAVSPLLDLKTTMLDHITAGNAETVGLWGRLSWELLGPAALLAIAGLVISWFRTSHRRERVAVAVVGAAAAVVYLITPYTGAGPDGIPFLLGSNIRYTMPAVFMGAALAAVAIPPRLLVLGTAAAFGFDGWRMARGYGFRTDLDLSTALVVVAVVALAALACAGLVTLGRRRPAYGAATLVTSGAASLLLVGIALGQIDDSVTPRRLDRVLSRAGRADVMVLGVDDMRSVLGSRLAAGVRTVSAGGRAGERPPASREQLDEAVRQANADVIVVRDGTPGVPKGWTPPEGWQRAARTREGDVYVRTPPSPDPQPPGDPSAPAPPKPPAP